MSPSNTVDVIIGPMIVQVMYTNWRGKRALRTIATPFTVTYGSNEWHPEPQWLMEAFDVDKQATRVFAMKDIEGLNLPPNPEKR